MDCIYPYLYLWICEDMYEYPVSKRDANTNPLVPSRVNERQINSFFSLKSFFFTSGLQIPHIPGKKKDEKNIFFKNWFLGGETNELVKHTQKPSFSANYKKGEEEGEESNVKMEFG